jgi:hypothetical protein
MRRLSGATEESGFAMQKGDTVLIKASRGEPGVRRVWDPAPERPWVCLEEYWARWLSNQVDPICWQVDRRQVFQHDAKLAQQLEEAFESARKGDAQAASRLERLWAQAKLSS